MPNNNHVVVKTSNKFNVAVSPSATVKMVGVHNARIDDGYLILIMDDLSEINVGMVQGEPGEDGISVVGVRYVNGILYLNMSDGTEYTVGTVRGEDGVSPEVSVVTIQGGHRVVFTDASGDHGFNVMDGTDGVSPEISVEDIANGHRVTITDATGTNVFDVENGIDGDDGVSPTVEITEISGGHKVTFTDASGEHSFNVMDGTGGGTSIHSQLTGRTDADQHPMSAITGLLAALESKMDADTPIPDEVTEQTVSGWGFTKNTGTYVKPSTGIPKTDLASDIQSSLSKADSALQSFTESDPTVPSWAKSQTKPSYTASEVGARPSTWTPTKSDIGLGNVDNVRQYSASNPPPYPVTSVNGQTGDVTVESGGTKSTTMVRTLPQGDAWTKIGDRYQISVQVNGVTETTPVVLVDVALSGTDLDADAAMLEAWMLVSANNVKQGNGFLTFYAFEAPSVSIQINVGVC